MIQEFLAIKVMFKLLICNIIFSSIDRIYSHGIIRIVSTRESFEKILDTIDCNPFNTLDMNSLITEVTSMMRTTSVYFTNSFIVVLWFNCSNYSIPTSQIYLVDEVWVSFIWWTKVLKPSGEIPTNSSLLIIVLVIKELISLLTIISNC